MNTAEIGLLIADDAAADERADLEALLRAIEDDEDMGIRVERIPAS